MDAGNAVSAPHAPRQNHLIAALPAEDYAHVLPKLEPVALQVGRSVHRAGERDRHLYFPATGIVSQFYLTESAASAEFALTGNEGVVGVAAFLSGESTPSEAVVLSAGYAYRIRASLLNGEFEHDGPLPRLLLGYTRSLIIQIGQVAMCNRFHSLEQRLCRWILSCLDRLQSNELTMTQELIAELLGVRRVGVTGAMGVLQEAGLIHCSRGRIAVLDRPQLEARACICHAVLKREHDRLLPERRRGEVAL